MTEVTATTVATNTRKQEAHEASLRLRLAQTLRDKAHEDFFIAQSRQFNAEAEMAEISLRAKLRVERAVMADNALNSVYVFDKAVTDATVKDCVKQMTTWSRQSVASEEGPCSIELQINSPGGSIFAGLALVDFMRGLSATGHHITAVAYGMAASMGGVILQAADTRVMGANSFLLLHEGSLFAAGDYGHVEDEYKLMKLLHARILDLFTYRSKVTKKFIETNWKRQDWWVPAIEALKHGFVDEVR